MSFSILHLFMAQHPSFKLLLLLLLLTGLRERDKREKSEEKIDCHHQDLNQGPSLVASDALTTELWCSRIIIVIIMK